MSKLVSFTAATVLAFSLAACGPKSNEAADSVGNAAEEALGAAENITDNAMNLVDSALASTPSAQEFVDRTAKSDAFEIAAAKLAVVNASAQSVKNYANEMIKAHTQSSARIKTAAGSETPAIRPDATLTREQSDMLADLGKRKGADFDASYMSGQVKAHEEALALLQDFSKNGAVESLKTAAAEIAPVVQEHLNRAKALNN